MLSDKPGSVVVPEFTISGTTPCIQSDIVYTATFAALNGQIGLPILTFNDMIVKWQTTDIAHVGAYSITVIGTVESATKRLGSLEFILNIETDNFLTKLPNLPTYLLHGSDYD